MPPESSEGYFSPSSAVRPTSSIFSRASWCARAGPAGRGYSRIGHGDVLADGERGEQRAELEQHAPALLHLDGRAGGAHRLAEGARSRPACGRTRPRMERSQDGLAGAGRADDGQDLAAVDVEVEILQDGRPAEPDGQAAHPDDRFALPSAPSEIDRAVEDGEDAVDDDHHEDRLHHRGRGVRGRATRRCRAPPCLRRRRSGAMISAMKGALMRPLNSDEKSIASRSRCDERRPA